MDTNNEMMVINRADIAIPADLDNLMNPGAAFLCSIPNDGSRAAAVAIYNAVNNKGESLADHKNEVLEIVNVAAHPVNLIDENTGELVEALRVVLIDKNGNNYDAVSQGIVSSLQKIFAIVGPAPYLEEPLKIKVVEQKTRKGFRTNTIELV